VPPNEKGTAVEKFYQCPPLSISWRRPGVRPSVYMSVSMSHSCIVSKRVNVFENFLSRFSTNILHYLKIYIRYGYSYIGVPCDLSNGVISNDLE